MQIKKPILLLSFLIIFTVPNLAFAKSPYHTFTRQQFKIKYSSKIWRQKDKKNYILLKNKHHQTKIRIQKITLNTKNQKLLKKQKTKKFSKINQPKIVKKLSNLNPIFQSAEKHKIKNKKNYKIILLHFNLNPGQLNAYYITNNNLFHRLITICQEENCSRYNNTFQRIIRSFRTIPDSTPPIFNGASSAVSTSTSSITISWTAATDKVSKSKNIKYLIYQANQLEEQNYTSPTYTTGKGVTSYQVNNLQEGTSYYLVVRAQDESKNIDNNTTEVIATTKITSNNDPVAGSIQYVSYPSNGSTVLARMYRPNGTGPFPIIIYNHGGITASDPISWDTRINQLRQGDTYAVIATAYRGDVGSQGSLSVSLNDVNDVLAAIEYAKSKTYLDPSRIGIFGESRGGLTTLSAISRNNTDPKITATWYPITDTKTYCEYVGNTYCLLVFGFNSIASQPNLSTDYTHLLRISSPVNFASKITMPLQNSHGTADVVVPFSQSQEFNAAMTGRSNYTFYEYQGADHGLSSEWSTTALTRLYQFFTNNL